MHIRIDDIFSVEITNVCVTSVAVCVHIDSALWSVCCVLDVHKLPVGVVQKVGPRLINRTGTMAAQTSHSIRKILKHEPKQAQSTKRELKAFFSKAAVDVRMRLGRGQRSANVPLYFFSVQWNRKKRCVKQSIAVRKRK